jgi:hypothetical protein
MDIAVIHISPYKPNQHQKKLLNRSFFESNTY